MRDEEILPAYETDEGADDDVETGDEPGCVDAAEGMTDADAAGDDVADDEPDADGTDAGTGARPDDAGDADDEAGDTDSPSDGAGDGDAGEDGIAEAEGEDGTRPEDACDEPEDAQDGTGDDATDAGETAKAKGRPRHRGRRVAAMLAGVACAGLLFSAGYYASGRTARAAEESAEIVRQYHEATDDLNDGVAAAQSVIDSGAPENAADPATYDAVKEAVESYGAYDVMIDTQIGWDRGDVNPFDYKGAEDAVARKREQLASVSEHDDIIRKATDAYEDSVYQKRLSDAKDELNKAIESASKAAGDIGEKVTEKESVSKVTELVSKAQEGLKQESDDVEWYKSQTDGINQAVSEMNASHDAWQKEQERIAAERAAAARARKSAARQSSGGSGSGGAWSPSVKVYEGMDIPYGGSTIYKWRDGYYLAHSTTSGGRSIASHPSTVNVGGKTYRYVSTQNVPYGADADSALAYARQNGGIGFQTCNGDGATMQINHYEPVS